MFLDLRPSLSEVRGEVEWLYVNKEQNPEPKPSFREEIWLRSQQDQLAKGV